MKQPWRGRTFLSQISRNLRQNPWGLSGRSLETSAGIEPEVQRCHGAGSHLEGRHVVYGNLENRTKDGLISLRFGSA